MKHSMLVLVLLLATSCIHPVKIPEPTLSKKSGITKIYSIFPDGMANCSGTFVSPRLVVTAAHCVRAGGTTSHLVAVSPGYQWGEDPHGLLPVEKVHVEKCWDVGIRGFTPHCDFAVLELFDEAPPEVFNYRVALPVNGSEYNFAGYAGGAGKPVSDSGRVKLAFGMLISKTHALKGMSGGPIYVHDKLVGVITMSSPSNSLGVALNKERIALINKLMTDGSESEKKR